MEQASLYTQDRLHRMNMPNAPSPLCIQCAEGEVDDIEHALLRCNKIKPGADFLLETETLKSEIPDLTLEHIKFSSNTVATLDLQILQKLLLAICSCKC